MPHRILIVEDSQTMRSMIAATLGESGDYEVVEAGSGFEAMRSLPRKKIDLIITDINMPNINGLELVSFVKNNDNYKDIPIIIVSTEGSEKDKEKGLSLGADEYLVKPFNPEELQEMVKNTLSKQD
jgi:two-component system chemotaxis response regulator CheY